MMPQNLTKDQFKKILNRYSSGLSSAQETRFVEQWFESLGKDSSIHLNERDQKEVEDKLWMAISTKVKGENQSGTNRNSISSYWKVTSIAAVLALAIVSFLYFNYTLRLDSGHAQAKDAHIETYFNESDTVKEVTLQDGSLVALQPNAKLSVKKFGDSNKREVYLDGEAFFEVTHDENNPFFVYTGDITTRVLGTSFNINANRSGKAIEVSVKTGRVSVTKTSKKSSSPLHTLTEEIILTPNQKAIYSRTGDEVLTALIDSPKRIVKAGDKLIMEFEEEPVSSILNVIQGAYGVDILFDEEVVSTCTLTTSLSDEDLYDRLNIICKAIRGSYELNGTQIIIHSKGCQAN
jgi:transmembrane sensor